MPGWTHIIPGRFGGDGRTDLLFYQASTGTGEFYTSTGSALLKPLKFHTGWRGSWRHIVPGHFGGDASTDLLFYDATAGVGEFYATQTGRSAWSPNPSSGARRGHVSHHSIAR